MAGRFKEKSSPAMGIFHPALFLAPCHLVLIECMFMVEWVLVCMKGKKVNFTQPLQEITYGITSSRGDFPMFTPDTKLVLHLATPKGCKTELILVVVTSQDSLPTRDGHLPQTLTGSAVTGIQSRKSDIVTTTPPSGL